MRYTDNYSNHDDRVLLVDDTDEDATQLLTVICDGNPRSNRGFDYYGHDAYRDGGRP
jgi:hypothetical protein